MTRHVEIEFTQMIAAARATGDPGELLRLYRNYILILASCQLSDRLRLKADASDLTQDVLLQAAHGFAKFQGNTQEEFTAWLRRILSRILANTWRHYGATQRRSIQLERRLMSDVSDSAIRLGRTVTRDASTPSEVAIRREQAALVADALAALPDEYRQVILLRQVEQLPFADVATQLGKSVASVRNIWPRALAKLRRQLEDLR